MQILGIGGGSLKWTALVFSMTPTFFLKCFWAVCLRECKSYHEYYAITSIKRNKLKLLSCERLPWDCETCEHIYAYCHAIL